MKVRGRNLIQISFIALLIVSALAPNIAVSGTTPTLYVEPATTTGNVGEDLFINVGISDIVAPESLYAWEFHLSFNPAVLNAYSHTRYLCSDRRLLTTQSGTAGSVELNTIGFKLLYEVGMRVWKRDALSTETEITAGSPVAMARQLAGREGVVEGAPWTCPLASIEPTDVLVARVYGRFYTSPTGVPTAWALVDEWVTDHSSTVPTLDVATWTPFYYVKVSVSSGKTYGELFFDTTTYDSHIEVTGIFKGSILSDAAANQGWETKFNKEADNTLGVIRMNEYIDPKTAPPKYPPVGATGGGILATIKLFVVGEGVTQIHFAFSELFTVTSETPVTISHKKVDGLFDNRAVMLPPNAVFTTPLYGIEALPVTFDASGSNDADDGGWIVSYEWDFDYDGSTFDVEATGVIATYTFPMAGTYTVALRVTDNDDLQSIASCALPVLIWMDGGWFPDLIQNQAWPDKPKWYESTDGREPNFYAKLGNPTEEEYEVYAEFVIFSKDEIKRLGVIRSPTVALAGGEKIDLSAVMDLTDITWRAFSGCPNPSSWNWVGYYSAYCRAGDLFDMRKYTVYTSCYYKSGSMSEFERGFAVKYFHFNVIPVKHDVGIASITTSPQGEVPQGGSLTVYINVTNNGDLEETFDVTLLYKGEFATGTVGVKQVTLQPGDCSIETFVWNTDSVPLGPYIVRGKLSILAFEAPKDIVKNQEAFTVVYIV